MTYESTAGNHIDDYYEALEFIIPERFGPFAKYAGETVYRDDPFDGSVGSPDLDFHAGLPEAVREYCDRIIPRYTLHLDRYIHQGDAAPVLAIIFADEIDAALWDFRP